MSVYAVSDLHGQLELYQEIKNFLEPEDKVICLGDCGDRGPKPWDTIKAVAADPQFIYLKGNHEDMLVGAMQELYGLPVKTESRYFNCGVACYKNGGYCTLEGWSKEKNRAEWINYLSNLPLVYKYQNKRGLEIICSHAGPTALLNPGTRVLKNQYIWNRDFDTWSTLTDSHRIILVHGHTPISFWSSKWKPSHGAFWYCGHRKVNIDCGSVWTNMTVLLDLDTFDEHIFFVDKT